MDAGEKGFFPWFLYSKIKFIIVDYLTINKNPQQLKKTVKTKPVETIHIKNAFPLNGSHLE